MNKSELLLVRPRTLSISFILIFSSRTKWDLLLDEENSKYAFAMFIWSSISNIFSVVDDWGGKPLLVSPLVLLDGPCLLSYWKTETTMKFTCLQKHFNSLIQQRSKTGINTTRWFIFWRLGHLNFIRIQLLLNRQRSALISICLLLEEVLLK